VACAVPQPATPASRAAPVLAAAPIRNDRRLVSMRPSAAARLFECFESLTILASKLVVYVRPATHRSARDSIKTKG
jgi:hypothetical protein